MAKSILATYITFALHNFKQGKPVFRVVTPIEYSFSDLAQIINIYCGYNHTDYDFLYHEYLDFWWDADSKNMVSIKTYFNNRNFDEIRLSEYFSKKGAMEYVHGQMKIYIQRRSDRKQTKVYPEMYNANGFFPTEDEFIKGKSNKDMEKLIEKDGLKEMDEKLKEYFKPRYKISDELGEYWTYKDVYKLKIIK